MRRVPSAREVTRPASLSTLRCCETAGRLTGTSSAISPTARGRAATRSKISRRVGSASAVNAWARDSWSVMTYRKLALTEAGRKGSPGVGPGWGRPVGWTGDTGPRSQRLPRRPQDPAAGGAQRADPDRTQAGVDQDPGQDGAGVLRAPRAGEVRGPAHGVPGGRLSQHLRVLGGPRGDVPHRRRP